MYLEKIYKREVLRVIMDDNFSDGISKKRRNMSYFDDYRDEIDIEEKDKIKDKVTSLKTFLDSFQKKIEGYEYVSSTDKITYTGRVLAGSNTIQKLVSLLSPFCENTNLIGEVNLEDFYRKKHRIHSTVNAILLTSIDVLPENYNTIIETFKNTFVNISNVSNNSKDLLKGQFSGNEQISNLNGDL